MPIQLYYTDISPASRSVLMTIKVLKLTVQLMWVTVSLTKCLKYLLRFDPFRPINTLGRENLSPEFLKINPQHCVPTLVDGDYVIWDSHSICTYLGSTYGKTLCPNADTAVRSRIDQRLHFHHGTLFTRYYRIIRSVFTEGAVDYKEPTLLRLVEEALEFLEIFLTGSKYLVGDKLTVADILNVTTVSSIFDVLEVDSSKYVNIVAWMKRLSKEIPYYEDIELPGVANMRAKMLIRIEDNRSKLVAK